MQLYEITIHPYGGFGTPLKGDTIFGHFCWQARYDDSLLDGGLAKHLERYPYKPFAVFSSAFPRLGDEQCRFALKKPDVPFGVAERAHDKDRASRIRKRKDLKKKKWLLVGADLSIRFDEARLLNEEQLAKRVSEGAPETGQKQVAGDSTAAFLIEDSRQHNTINRMTWTTGEGRFAPYTQTVRYFLPGARLAVLALIDEAATSVDRVVEAFRRIGRSGFGRDASTGLGRFEVESCAKLAFPGPGDAKALYCLAPCVPVPNSFKRAFFTPFVRFGKHGDALAISSNPFKNPVITADEGAVFIPSDSSALQNPYFGSAVTGISKAQPNAVMQGYSISLPMRVEGYDD